MRWGWGVGVGGGVVVVVSGLFVLSSLLLVYCFLLEYGSLTQCME